MVVQAYNPTTQAAEARGSPISGHPGQISKALSENTVQKSWGM
jgi:hypothetical protein